MKGILSYRKHISNIALSILLCIYTISAFTGAELTVLSAAAGAVVLILNLPYMGKTFKLPAWIFCGLGVAVLAVCRAPLSQWIYGMNAMMKTVVILIAVQTLSLAINVGRYEEAVSGVLNGNVKLASTLFIILVLLSHLLAGVMSLGSVVIIIAAILPAVTGRLKDERGFIAEAITIGYCTLFLWAPGTVTVLMSMQVFDLSWGEYFAPAFLLAVIGLLLGCVVGWLKYRHTVMGEAGDSSGTAEAAAAVNKEMIGNDTSSLHRIAELATVLIIIVIGISALEKIGFANATGRMTVVSLAVSAIWLMILKVRQDKADASYETGHDAGGSVDDSTRMHISGLQESTMNEAAETRTDGSYLKLNKTCTAGTNPGTDTSRSTGPGIGIGTGTDTGTGPGPGISALWWNKKLPGNNDLYTFFLAMGVFSAAISYSGFDMLMADAAQNCRGMLDIFIIPLLPVIIIGLSLIGIHPFISVLTVGQIINTMALAASPLQLGLSMSLGCCLSYMVSPFAGLILTMSDSLKLTQSRICFGINMRFALLYYCVGVAFIYMVR